MESLNPIYLLGYRAPLVRSCLSVFCLLATACTCCSSQDLSRKQELKLRIVYDYKVVSGRAGDPKPWQDIYTIDAYGADVKRLTSDHRSNSPVWSRDGRQIAFLRDEPEGTSQEIVRLKDVWFGQQYPTTNRDLSVISMNGEGARRIASVGPYSSILQWLPNTEWIALHSSNRYDLRVCITHGKRLNAKCDRWDTMDGIIEDHRREGRQWVGPSFGHEYYPASDNFLPAVLLQWGFHKMPSSQTDEVDKLSSNIPLYPDLAASIGLSSLEGTSAQAPVSAYDAAWSADGKRLAYSAFSGGHNSILYIADLKDSHADSPRAITEEAINAHSPVWSADGSRIAFAGLWEGTQQIFAINVDGTDLVQVSRKHDLSCTHPSWSPDGSLIVAECHDNVIFRNFNAYADIEGWGSSIYLFDMSKLGHAPRALVECSASALICGAHNPSFAPVEATQ